MTAVACPRAWAARIASPTPPQAACRRSAAARAPRLSALPSSQNDSKTAPLNTDGAAAARRRTSAAAARPAGAAGAASADDRAAQKQLNKRICSARSAGEVLELVGDGGMLSFNLINAVTAFHRLAKHGMRLPLEEQPALAAHPATRQLATWLEAAAATSRLSDVQAAQLLWGHSQLGHGTARLVDAVYAQLSDAEVVCSTSRSGSSMNEPSSTGSSSSSKIGCRTERTSSTNSTSSIDSRRSSSSASKDSSSSGSVMQLESMGTAVTLVYAMARLHRPAPTLLASLIAALLAADDSGSSRRGWSSEQPAWQGQQQQQQGAGISLSCCDQRSLCLLLWSLATLGCCPRKLLLRGCAMLRHAGLAELSVRSMTQVLQAQDMAGSWDQQLVDDVAAELALRWHSSFDQQPNEGERHHEQHHYHHQKPSLRLNELDTSILARCLALAWRHAVAASVAGEEAFGNRLATGRVLSRHITASPHRCAAAQLLAASVRDLSPRLSPQGVSSLAHSFASMGGCPPDLLEALAERALELESKLDGQAVANLAWSYSSLRYDHPQLYSSLASAALRLLATPLGGHSAQLAGGGRGSFSAQAVSMLVFGFASANRCDSPEQQQLMLELAGRAAEVLEDFTPQGLSNLGWGLVVAACYPRQLLRRWRAMVGATAPHFKEAELNQLHLVEVALRLEAPGIGLHLPSQSASFFEGLYQTGRLRVFARHAWQRTLSTGPRSITDFQMQVHRTICELGVECELEHSPVGEYSVDIALPQHRVAVEVDGPVHFATNSRHLMGGTALKRRLLQRLGWHAVDVPFYDWWRLRPAQRQQYMRRKLQAAGLTLPEALAQEAHQHAADVAAAAPDVAADAATTDAQSTVLKLAPQPQLEAAAAEKPCSSSNEGALEAPAAASLAQRAQRLSMLQYRQGKLARGSMLARGKMQAAGAAEVASHEEMGATDEVQTAPPSAEATTEPGRAAARHTM